MNKRKYKDKEYVRFKDADNVECVGRVLRAYGNAYTGEYLYSIKVGDVYQTGEETRYSGIPEKRIIERVKKEEIW